MIEVKEKAEDELEEAGFIEQKPGLYLRDLPDKTEYVDVRKESVSTYAYDDDENKKPSKEAKRLKRLIERLNDEAQETLI